MTLVSVPKLADAGYTTVFSKEEWQSRMITPPQLQPTSPSSWKPIGATLQAFETSPSTQKKTVANKDPPNNEAINVIFDLPSACQNFL